MAEDEQSKNLDEVLKPFYERASDAEVSPISLLISLFLAAFFLVQLTLNILSLFFF